MKRTVYECNLCGHVNFKSMNSLVKNQKHNKYLLSTKDDSGIIHICDNCIKMLGLKIEK